MTSDQRVPDSFRGSYVLKMYRSSMMCLIGSSHRETPGECCLACRAKHSPSGYSEYPGFRELIVEHLVTSCKYLQ